MKPAMSQAEIDALLKDSMFEDSSIQESKQPKTEKQTEQNYEESNNYGNEQFESYEESRKTFEKNVSKKEFNEGKKPIQSKKTLQDIKQETPNIGKSLSKDKKEQKSIEKPKSKTGIYFYPPKQYSTGPPVPDKKNLPYNYARLQQREKELLLTTLTEEAKQLKEEARRKDNEYKKLENTYKMLLQEKAHQAPSVKEAILQKQLATLQSKYDKLQNLCKLQKERNQYKTSKTSQGFIPEVQVCQREEELLEIIDHLKERLMSTNTELKTLQAKMSEGENYIDELKKKMKRVQQLQFKMEKMAEQAENDRDYITQLKQKNSKLDSQVFQLQKEKRLMEVQIRRYQLGQSTQKDVLAELQEVKQEKEILERNLRELAANMTSISKKRQSQPWAKIQDSGELLKP